MSPKLHGAWAFGRALALPHLLTNRAAIESFQERKLKDFLKAAARDVAAFAGLTNQPLSAWPLMDKAKLMGDFAAFNRLGLSAEQAWEAYREPSLLPGYSVGASTGTSGNRGLFLVSDAERFFWLGVMLARTLPQAMLSPQRVALVLPTTSRLYETANESRRLALRFFDVGLGALSHVRALEEFAPTVLIGSPHGLRALAEADTKLAPAHVFSGAEVLDPIDRALIEARWGVLVREIYMATEGLFGIACRHGRLHLLEDHVKFEWADQGHGLVSPIITDFSRKTQMMIRYQMNDVLALDDRACPCGSKLQAVSAVHGRCDDVFVFGCGTRVTPDVIRNAIVTTDQTISDFRADQIDQANIQIALPDGPQAWRSAVQASLEQALGRAGVAAPVNIQIGQGAMPALEARKLRRVRRLFSVEIADRRAGHK